MLVSISCLFYGLNHKHVDKFWGKYDRYIQCERFEFKLLLTLQKIEREEKRSEQTRAYSRPQGAVAEI